MARQPLKKRLPETGLWIGAGLLSQRPKAAAVIAEIIALWTEVELQSARLLAAMIGGHTEPGAALYLSLANARAKREAMDSIADFVFTGQSRDIYNAIMKAKFSLEKERVDLAHGLFGIATSDPEGILFISTSDRIKHILDVDKKQENNTFKIDDELKIKEFVYHYKIEDLKKILSDIDQLHRTIMTFIPYARSVISNYESVELRQRLLNEPLVQKSLSQTIANRKNE